MEEHQIEPDDVDPARAHALGLAVELAARQMIHPNEVIQYAEQMLNFLIPKHTELH